MNDKCAAGTGRFLEMMAKTLRVPLPDIGGFSLDNNEDIAITSLCAVFAKSEVIRYMRRGTPKADILAGLHEATTDRVIGILKRVGIVPEFVVSGGIAKNIGVVRRVEKRLGMTAHIATDPQIIGALGAAIFAWDMLGSEMDSS
jgi:predicted CoA-substrate-specific enzyme activase